MYVLLIIFWWGRTQFSSTNTRTIYVPEIGNFVTLATNNDSHAKSVDQTYFLLYVAPDSVYQLGHHDKYDMPW